MQATLSPSRWILLCLTAVAFLGGCATDPSATPALVFAGPGAGEENDALGSAEDAGVASSDSPTAERGGTQADGGPAPLDIIDPIPGDASAAPDSANPPDITAPVDAADPQDASPLPDLPGPDGATSPPDALQPDVPSKDTAVADVTPAAVCGNGVCQAPTETALTCPADCATGLKACLTKSCAAQTAACLASASCGAVVDCAAKCPDTGCMQACASNLDYGTLINLVAPLAQCAQQVGCLAASGGGPGGGPSTCGNGACDGGETHLTCPKDCVFPVSANEQCQVQKCAAPYNACASDFACVAAATCYNKGNSIYNCTNSQTTANKLSALVQCIQSACSGAASGPSCAGKCGNYIKSDPCYCDAQCKKYNDCCPDYTSLCGG